MVKRGTVEVVCDFFFESLVAWAEIPWLRIVQRSIVSASFDGTYFRQNVQDQASGRQGLNGTT